MSTLPPNGRGSTPRLEDTLVSIAIPVHDGARYLAETLTSAIQQTHKALEIIVVDDCSTDDSAALTEDFARRDSRVRVMRNDANIGMVGNWNQSVAACSGRWVHLTGQDDLLAPNAIESMLRAAAPDTRLVMAARCFSFEPGCPRRLRCSYAWELPTLETLGVSPGVVTPGDMARLLSRLPSPCTNFLGEPVCALVRRDMFEERGLFNDAFAQLADYEFWLRCALHEPFVYVARPLFTFRVHGQSATQVHLADRVRGVHMEYALLLLELLESVRFAGARSHHAPLIPLWEDALLREIIILQNCASRDVGAAEAIMSVANHHPGLARRMGEAVPGRQRIRIALDGWRGQLRRFGSAGWGRHLIRRPHAASQ